MRRPFEHVHYLFSLSLEHQQKHRFKVMKLFISLPLLIEHLFAAQLSVAKIFSHQAVVLCHILKRVMERKKKSFADERFSETSWCLKKRPGCIRQRQLTECLRVFAGLCKCQTTKSRGFVPEKPVKFTLLFFCFVLNWRERRAERREEHTGECLSCRLHMHTASGLHSGGWFTWQASWNVA